MELLNLYLESLPIESKGYSQEGKYSVWDDFINNDAHQISVVAGRQTGKTTAVIKRALLRNEKDIILAVGVRHSIPMYCDKIHEIARELGMECETASRDHTSIVLLVNEHCILVTTINQMRGFGRGYFSNCEVIMDEPEHTLNNYGPDELDFLEDLLEHSPVALVGSYIKYEWSAVKGFHNRTGTRSNGFAQVIKTQNVHGRDFVAHLRNDMNDRTFLREFECVVS